MAIIEKLLFKEHFVQIELDTGESLKVSYDVYFQYDILRGIELENNVYLELYDESIGFDCSQKALGFLALRSRSAEEMRRYLRKKKYPDAQVEKTVLRLVEEGYINDYNFALSMVHERIKQGRWGKDLIVRDLYLKGVSREIIDRVVRETGADKPDMDVLYKLAVKKYISVKNKNDSIVRVGSFLRSRGFDFSSIKSVLDRIISEGL